MAELIPICAADALAEGGKGIRFPLTAGGEDAGGFVVRFEGVARAYLNRCAHVPIELDWNEASAAQLECIPTFVTFRDLPDTELDAYLRIEQPYDCAGSAKNEGLGIALLEKIESSDPTALTGLPLIALTTMLRHAGVPFFRKSP